MPVSAMADYYRDSAALWEIQALLKVRPVAGAAEVGDRFVEAVRPVVAKGHDPDEVAASIRDMRDQAVRSGRGREQGRDVKSGLGGIRDVEFLVQGLQLVHLPRHPALFTGNTLGALECLAELALLPGDVTSDLSRDYLFLRRVEHCLQILEDRQIHVLPRSSAQLEALAKRVLGVQAGADDLARDLEAAQARIRRAYDTYLG
jgi:glutamate-ammonia-ligase adenylyltransferase